MNENALVSANFVKVPFFQQSSQEFLGEILSVMHVIAPSADKRIQRIPIGAANSPKAASVENNPYPKQPNDAHAWCKLHRPAV